MTEKTSFVFKSIPPGYRLLFNEAGNACGWETTGVKALGLTEADALLEAMWFNWGFGIAMAHMKSLQQLTRYREDTRLNAEEFTAEEVKVGPVTLTIVQGSYTSIMLDDDTLIWETKTSEKGVRAEGFARFAGQLIALYGMPPELRG